MLSESKNQSKIMHDFYAKSDPQIVKYQQLMPDSFYFAPQGRSGAREITGADGASPAKVRDRDECQSQRAAASFRQLKIDFQLTSSIIYLRLNLICA
jgi:hypothetical protein